MQVGFDEEKQGIAEQLKSEQEQKEETKKNQLKKQKIIKGVLLGTATAVVVCAIVLITVLSLSMSQNKFNQKMDEWVSLLNYDGLSEKEIADIENSTSNTDFKTRYIQSIETLAAELKLGSFGDAGKDWDKHKGYPYADQLAVYVEKCDIDRLMIAAHRGHKYGASSTGDLYPDGSECIYTAIYKVFPERFIKPILEDGIDNGYYVNNPKAHPGVTRQEPYSQDTTRTNTYTVKHYGDFAIQESETWEVDDWSYYWVDKKVYKTPASYLATQSTDLYYKGDFVFTIQDKWGEQDINQFLIYENDDYRYKYYIVDGILTDCGYSSKN